MAFFALVAQSHEDLPALQDTLQRILSSNPSLAPVPHGSVPQPQQAPVAPVVQPQPVAPVAAPVVDGLIGRPPEVRGWKSLYSRIAAACGLSDLSTAQRDAVKATLPKDGQQVPLQSVLQAVAAVGLAPVAPVAQQAPVVDQQALALQQAADQAHQALMAHQAQQAPVVQQAPAAGKLQALPAMANLLTQEQVNKLFAYANTLTAARKEAVMAYLQGQNSLQAVAAVYDAHWAKGSVKLLKAVNA